LGILALGDVRYRPHEFQVIRFAERRRMTHNANVLHRTIRHQQPVFKIKVLPLPERSLGYLLDQRPIFRVSSPQYPFQRRLAGWFKFEDPKCLLGPENLSARYLPAKTAGVA